MRSRSKIRSIAIGASKGYCNSGESSCRASVIYGQLKEHGQIEPYERRAAPWKSPRYEVWQRNQMWGSDWTKLSVGGVRWYLLTVIDFFSRWIIAWEVMPT